MDVRQGSISVRISPAFRKAAGRHTDPAHRAPYGLAGRWPLRVCTAAIIGLAALVSLAGCALQPPTKTVTLTALETAPAEPLPAAQRLVASDSAALRSLCTPLGPRLGLLQVRSADDWRLYRQVVTAKQKCPDLQLGSVVGIVCWAGTPLDGQWPVSVEAVQVEEGGGLLKARFHGGTYQPDGIAYLETGYVPGLRSVLVVNVNGTSFFPQDGR
jgi:hypothetical protein